LKNVSLVHVRRHHVCLYQLKKQQKAAEKATKKAAEKTDQKAAEKGPRQQKQRPQLEDHGWTIVTYSKSDSSTLTPRQRNVYRRSVVITL
jgi:hypothetical protein